MQRILVSTAYRNTIRHVRGIPDGIVVVAHFSTAHQTKRGESGRLLSLVFSDDVLNQIESKVRTQAQNNKKAGKVTAAIGVAMHAVQVEGRDLVEFDGTPGPRKEVTVQITLLGKRVTLDLGWEVRIGVLYEDLGLAPPADLNAYTFESLAQRASSAERAVMLVAEAFGGQRAMNDACALLEFRKSIEFGRISKALHIAQSGSLPPPDSPLYDGNPLWAAFKDMSVGMTVKKQSLGKLRQDISKLCLTMAERGHVEGMGWMVFAPRHLGDAMYAAAAKEVKRSMVAQSVVERLDQHSGVRQVNIDVLKMALEDRARFTECAAVNAFLYSNKQDRAEVLALFDKAGVWLDRQAQIEEALCRSAALGLASETGADILSYLESVSGESVTRLQKTLDPTHALVLQAQAVGERARMMKVVHDESSVVPVSRVRRRHVGV